MASTSHSKSVQASCDIETVLRSPKFVSSLRFGGTYGNLPSFFLAGIVFFGAGGGYESPGACVRKNAQIEKTLIKSESPA
jgi:hypothetical protein